MKSRFLVSLGAFALAALACSIFVGGPEYPEAPIAPSTQSLEDAQVQIEKALTESAETGHFKLVITQSQLTAYLTAKLDEQSTPVITKPQVVLQDGVARIYGQAQSGLLVATISATAKITVDENGQPQLEISHADFGPVPMPEGLVSGLSAFLQEALTGQLGPAAIGFRLESIDISDGVLTVTGRTK
jgi:uncharacterized protein YpmS